MRINTATMDSSSDYSSDKARSASTDRSRYEAIRRPGGGYELVPPSTTSEEITSYLPLISSQLRSNMLFLSIDDATIAEIAGQFEIVQYEPGHVIVEQGKVKKNSHDLLS